MRVPTHYQQDNSAKDIRQQQKHMGARLASPGKLESSSDVGVYIMHTTDYTETDWSTGSGYRGKVPRHERNPELMHIAFKFEARHCSDECSDF